MGRGKGPEGDDTSTLGADTHRKGHRCREPPELPFPIRTQLYTVTGIKSWDSSTGRLTLIRDIKVTSRGGLGQLT